MNDLFDVTHSYLIHYYDQNADYCNFNVMCLQCVSRKKFLNG